MKYCKNDESKSAEVLSKSSQWLPKVKSLDKPGENVSTTTALKIRLA